MSKWRETTIGEQIQLQRGYDITRASQTIGEVPVVSSGGISSTHGESIAPGPGVVMGRKGTLGNIFYLDMPYWPHDTTLWVRDFKGNHPRFVYYFLHTLNFAYMDVGSANPTLNRNHVHPMICRWPDINTQHAIAEVLGALDDKIAANRRISDLTLDLLDSIYARTTKTRTGLTFEDVASLGGGGTPSTKNPSYWGPGLAWATPSDITSTSGAWLLDTSRAITDAGLASISSLLYPVGSILMSSIASIGPSLLCSRPTAINQGIIALVPKSPEARAWLFAQVRARTSEFVSWSNGATFLELPKGVFRSLAVDWPTDQDLSAFADFADPLLDRALAAERENQVLASTRDELLPLLMSGRITVGAASSRVEEVV